MGCRALYDTWVVGSYICRRLSHGTSRSIPIFTARCSMGILHFYTLWTAPWDDARVIREISFGCRSSHRPFHGAYHGPFHRNAHNRNRIRTWLGRPSSHGIHPALQITSDVMPMGGGSFHGISCVSRDV